MADLRQQARLDHRRPHCALGAGRTRWRLPHLFGKKRRQAGGVAGECGNAERGDSRPLSLQCFAAIRHAGDTDNRVAKVRFVVNPLRKNLRGIPRPTMTPTARKPRAPRWARNDSKSYVRAAAEE